MTAAPVCIPDDVDTLLLDLDAYHSRRMFDLIDLHTHSHHSDGTLAPAELVARAAQRRVTVLALTDHDTTAGCAEALDACRAQGIGFVPGAELTVSWRGQEIHVVGLGLDPDSAVLRGQIEDVLSRRRTRITAIGVKLRAEKALAALQAVPPERQRYERGRAWIVRLAARKLAVKRLEQEVAGSLARARW